VVLTSSFKNSAKKPRQQQDQQTAENDKRNRARKKRRQAIVTSFHQLTSEIDTHSSSCLTTVFVDGLAGEGDVS
jgi:hypothetical protein